jgi:hypothetical protein
LFKKAGTLIISPFSSTLKPGLDTVGSCVKPRWASLPGLSSDWVGDSISTRGEGGSLDGPAIALRFVVMAEDAEGFDFGVTGSSLSPGGIIAIFDG